jgi:hypothetical protein
LSELLRAGLELRDRHAAGEISRHGQAVARGRLENHLFDLIFPTKANAANERWPATCGTIATSCSRSCESRGWTPPTGGPGWPSASGSSFA